MNRHWEQIRRNPVPSLLTALLEDHLDPGYAAAARDRTTSHARPVRKGVLVWITVGALLVGLTIGIAYAETSDRGPGSDRVQAEMLAGVRAASQRAEVLTATRDDLAVQIDRRREELFADNTTGTGVLDVLRRTDCARRGCDPDDAPRTPPQPPRCTVQVSR